MKFHGYYLVVGCVSHFPILNGIAATIGKLIRSYGTSEFHFGILQMLKKKTPQGYSVAFACRQKVCIMLYIYSISFVLSVEGVDSAVIRIVAWVRLSYPTGTGSECGDTKRASWSPHRQSCFYVVVSLYRVSRNMSYAVDQRGLKCDPVRGCRGCECRRLKN